MIERKEFPRDDSGSFDRVMVKPARGRGVRAKLVGTYFLVSISAIVLAALIDIFGISGTSFKGRIEVRTEAAGERLGQHADVIAAEIRLWLDGQRHQVEMLAGNDLVSRRVARILGELRSKIGPEFSFLECWREQAFGEDYSDLLSLFRLLVETPGGPRSVWLVDSESGFVVLATDIRDLGSNIHGDGFLRQIVDGHQRPGIGMGRCGRNEAVGNVLVVNPILGISDALLVMHFDPEVVLEPVLAAARNPEWSLEAWVVDHDGTLLTALEHPLPDGAQPRTSVFLMNDRASVHAAQGKEGLIECTDYRGRRVLAATHSVGLNRDQKWGVVVTRDLDDVLAPMYLSIKHLVFAGLAALVALSVVVLMIARGFIRPILEIARVSNRIARGDFDARAPVTTTDEIGALAGVFNIMADRIQETQEDLELRVRERTASLRDAMAALKAEVDQRRRTEVKLRESEATYRAVGEESPVMLCRFLPDGEITFANDLYRKYFQPDGADLVGKNIGKLGVEDDTGVIDEHLAELTPERPVEDHEHRATTVRDGVRWFHWSNRVLFDSDGKILSVLSVGLDITDRKESEEKLEDLTLHLEERVQARTAELRERVSEVEDLNRAILNLADDVGRSNRELEVANQRMEEANRELNSFAYSVSHDLRAPLRHIAGFVALLQATTSERLTEEEWRFLTLVAQSAERMSGLIDDLLDFSRTGTRDMVVVEVDLRSLVLEVSSDVQERAGDREITWNIGELPRVMADRSTLRIALVNLLENAVKYTRDRPNALIEIGADGGKEDQEIIWIRDNGVGFDPKYTGKLFGVFQRLHRKEDFEGTGIGLANVRRIINRHGGRTWAKGAIDQGATFFFSLPKSPAQGFKDS